MAGDTAPSLHGSLAPTPPPSRPSGEFDTQRQRPRSPAAPLPAPTPPRVRSGGLYRSQQPPSSHSPLPSPSHLITLQCARARQAHGDAAPRQRGRAQAGGRYSYGTELSPSLAPIPPFFPDLPSSARLPACRRLSCQAPLPRPRQDTPARPLDSATRARRRRRSRRSSPGGRSAVGASASPAPVRATRAACAACAASAVFAFFFLFLWRCTLQGLPPVWLSERGAGT